MKQPVVQYGSGNIRISSWKNKNKKQFSLELRDQILTYCQDKTSGRLTDKII